MTNPRKILRLDLIESPVAGQFDLGDGKLHDVLQPTIRQQQILISIESNPTAASFDEMHAVVRALVPSLSDEQFGALSNEQVTAIVTMATGNIDAVEKLFPNAVSPETPPTSPG